MGSHFHFMRPPTEEEEDVGGHREMKTADNKTSQLETIASRTLRIKDFMT